MEAYAKEGSAEAAARKLCIILTRLIAGRSAEGAWTTWDGLMPDKLYKKFFLETPQIKTNKPKYNALCPGRTRHSDFYTAMADFFSMQGYGVHSPGDVPWILPMLRVSDPANKMSSFLKVTSCLSLPTLSCRRACLRVRVFVPTVYLADIVHIMAALRLTLPRVSCCQALLPNGAQKYKDYCIHDLPEDISAAGIRGGAINELQCKHPFEQNLHATGQDGAVRGSVFYANYAGFNKGAANTCGGTLVGWPPPEYGREREGPFCADLYALRDIGVDIDQLQLVIDKQFNLHSASYPPLLTGGRLRPLVERCFASLVMYYPERCVKNLAGQVSMIEMREVSIKLITCLREKYSYSAGGMANGGDPDLTLRRWAAHIKAQFELANLAITSRQETGIDANIIVNAVQGLAGVPACLSLHVHTRASLSPLMLLGMLYLFGFRLTHLVCPSGTVSNLAQGMTELQREQQRVRGREEYIRENEQLRQQIKTQSTYIVSLEEQCNVPPDQRYNAVASVQVPSAPPQDASLMTPGGEW